MFRLKAKKRSRRSPSRERQKSGPVYSYYSNRAQSQESGSRRINKAGRIDSKPPRLPRWIHNLPTTLAIMAIAISIIYSIGLNSNPKIIQPANNDNIFLQNINTYQNAAHKLFNRSIFNSNKITVNVSGITQDMQNQFPELDSVSITLPLIGHQPIIYIIPSQPALILNANNGSFVLNNRGVAIIKTYQAANITKLNLPTVIDNSDLSVNLGRGALPANDINFITTVYGQLRAQKRIVDSLTLPAVASELDVRIKGQPYFIKMNMQSDAKEQVGAFLATSAHLDKLRQSPQSYFDVRVEGRVYYR